MLDKGREVGSHCSGFLHKQTTPIAVLAGLLVLQVLMSCFGNSREPIVQPVFFNETSHEGDYR
jgi:hypothetical protein